MKRKRAPLWRRLQLLEAATESRQTLERRVHIAVSAGTDAAFEFCRGAFSELLDAWRSSGAPPVVGAQRHALHLIVTWTMERESNAPEVGMLTELEYAKLLTIRRYCSGCRARRQFWDWEQGSCTSCHDVPVCRRYVEQHRRSLEANLDEVARLRSEQSMAQAQQRLADALEIEAQCGLSYLLPSTDPEGDAEFERGGGAGPWNAPTVTTA